MKHKSNITIDECCGCHQRKNVREVHDTVTDMHDYGEYSKPIKVIYLVCDKCLTNDDDV